ncbi:MAG: GDSL-type esterase/lipase family protein [Chthoniobacteraceae bacterium]
MKYSIARYIATRAWKIFLSALVFSVALTRLAKADEEALKSQLNVEDAAIARSAANAFRILFIGDSITRHGTNEDIKKSLHWDHVAGMAASAEEKDYVHLLAAKIQATLPGRKVEIYYDSQAKKLSPLPANLQGGSAEQKWELAKATASFKPHLVVIQLGEHENTAKGAEAFRKSYDGLVGFFTDQPTPPQVICAGVWQPGDIAAGKDSYIPNGWAGTVDRVMGEVGQARGVAFATVRAYALDPKCRGWGENGGVQWHPNDKGMEGYTHVLFEAYQRNRGGH